MRRSRCALAAVLFLSASALPGAAIQAKVDADLSPGIHRSITIEGDDGFLAPESGVRQGAGTPDDPFVIANWTLVLDKPHGILLRRTTAHVVIENVFFVGGEGQASDEVVCRADSSACGPVRGLFLDRAQNVVIRGLRGMGADVGVYILESRSVIVADSQLSSVDNPSVDAVRDDIGTMLTFTDALFVSGGEDIRLENVTFGSASRLLSVFDVRNLLVEDSTFVSTGSILSLVHAAGLTIRNSYFSGTEVWLAGSVLDFRFEGNVVTEALRGLWATPFFSPRFQGFSMCGNSFQGITDPDGALSISEADGVAVLGNLFVANTQGIRIGATNLTIEGNMIRDSERFGLSFSSEGASVHQNAFINNGKGVGVSRPSDVRLNWWGHPTGPSGIGPGQGDPLSALEGGVVYDPWLVEPPPFALGCPSSIERQATSLTAPSHLQGSLGYELREADEPALEVRGEIRTETVTSGRDIPL